MRGALARGRAALAHLPDPLRDARALLAHAAGLGRDEVHRLDDGDLTGEVIGRFDALVAERSGGMPLARLLGYRDFWAHRFRITSATLDPRADTEALVARALDLDWQTVLDLGTGSGCILVSLLAERATARGMGTDLSGAALDVARDNARGIGVADRATFRQADWFDGVEERFDLIVANPPYIAAGEMPSLAPEVRDYDPVDALSDHADGLSAYRAIAAGALDHLEDQGHLLVEIGWRQREDVIAILNAAGMGEIACHSDLEGRDRVISARKP